MNLLIEYLKSIGSEYQISSSDGSICVSQKYYDIDKSESVTTNIHSYKNHFYEKKYKTIKVEGVVHNISTYTNVTKYTLEIMKSKMDCLTRLPNRMQLQKYLDNLNNPSVIVMCDIDDFKKVNDTFGHQIGDGVIMLLGDLIRANIDPDDFAGRYGGEEFLIIYNTDDVDEVKRKIDEFNLFLNKYSKKITISISAGIHHFDPASEDIKTAVKKADEALYYVKQHGKNNSIIYENIKRYGGM